MAKTAKTKNKAWFIYVRKSYLPRSWQGLSIYIAYVTYIVAVPIAWYNQGHNAWKLLTTVLPLIVAVTILTQYIASKNAK